MAHCCLYVRKFALPEKRHYNGEHYKNIGINLRALAASLDSRSSKPQMAFYGSDKNIGSRRV